MAGVRPSRVDAVLPAVRAAEGVEPVLVDVEIAQGAVAFRPVKGFTLVPIPEPCVIGNFTSVSVAARPWAALRRSFISISSAWVSGTRGDRAGHSRPRVGRGGR